MADHTATPIPPSPILPPADRLSQLRSEAALISAGGHWVGELSQAVQRNLRWFWFDGAFALGIDSIVNTYLVLYAVALGASSAQIGLLGALSGLGAALTLLPGALLVERIGRRKEITLAAGGAVGRIMILLLVLLPFALQGQTAVYLFIGLVVVRDAFGSLSLPAWTSLAADIVPLGQRGRYFASRNIAMTITGMVTAFLAGVIINQSGSPSGYQWAFLMAFGCGAASWFCFSRIKDPVPRPPPRPARAGSAPLLGGIFAHKPFLALCVHSAVWNFALNVAGPFFNIYLVHDLRATMIQVGILTAATSLASLPALRVFGPLSDRWGPRRIILITSLLIPILPIAWIFVPSPWYVLAINLASGVLWSGFSMCVLNLLLQISPEAERARFTAVHQIIVAVSLALGAAFGGWVVTAFGYKAVFAISGIGRLVAALIFARYVTERPQESAAPAHG
ncbi:MAG: MFS transporter [Anaerolineales bacterium]|nr:MFS transporter [Anaerolineales bacterium]